MNIEEGKYIQKLYKRQALDLLLFGFVSGVIKSFPSMSLKDCIFLFQNEFSLTEDDLPLETARSTYYRMQKEMHEACGKKQQANKL